MIPRAQLRKSSRAKLGDAAALFRARRYDGAVYLCGYAVELALKARICTTLKWTTGWPSTNKEFEGLSSFKTHDFDTLLRLSGRKATITAAHFEDWSIVTQWSPESRYEAPGKVGKDQAALMIDATRRLLRA